MDIAVSLVNAGNFLNGNISGVDDLARRGIFIMQKVVETQSVRGLPPTIGGTVSVATIIPSGFAWRNDLRVSLGAWLNPSDLS
jgi:hypothetical protein